mmetsp:Transcript_509/g.637  ORF Transcript_509/g.637 Transcript_509/m.637 type:complete len:88 (+) Transcript_509:2512-2775(+)
MTVFTPRHNLENPKPFSVPNKAALVLVTDELATGSGSGRCSDMICLIVFRKPMGLPLFPIAVLDIAFGMDDLLGETPEDALAGQLAH